MSERDFSGVKNGHSGGGPCSAADGKRNLERELLVGGLSSDTTDDDLREYFSKYGECELLMHQHRGRFHGFAFLLFSEASSVDNVIAFKKHVLQGEKLIIEKTENNSADKIEPTSNIRKRIHEERGKGDEATGEHDHFNDNEYPEPKSRKLNLEDGMIQSKQEYDMKLEIAKLEMQERLENRKLDLEKSRLEIEREKLILEEKKEERIREENKRRDELNQSQLEIQKLLLDAIKNLTSK